MQHTRIPCPSPSCGVCSNSYPSSQWCHPTISSSMVPFSSCLPSFLASGAFPMSQLFASGDQSIRASASASVLPVNIQGWFPSGLTAAAAKLLQSCPTPYDPTDSSPPGSPVPGILQARTLEWGCHFLLQCMKVKSESEVAQSCPTLSDPMDCSLPGSSVHGIF